MKLKPDEVLLLKLLARSSGKLHAYTIYRRMGISMSVMGAILARLGGLNLLTSDGETASLTDEGNRIGLRLISRSNKPSGDSKSEIDGSAYHFKDFDGPSIGINVAYAPKYSELPRSLRHKLQNLS